MNGCQQSGTCRLRCGWLFLVSSTRTSIIASLYAREHPSMATGKQTGFAHRILVVDDEPLILETAALIFGKKGYEVRTAADGFAALVELRRAIPDIIVSDLSMPRMSGFELLSIVRRRFPHVAVIAMSGEYHGIAPHGLICDAFFWKGHYEPDEMLSKIAEL